MPVYKIPAGGGGQAQDAWGAGASALAQAFTRDIDSEISAAKAGQDIRTGQAREDLLRQQALTSGSQAGLYGEQTRTAAEETRALKFKQDELEVLYGDVADGRITPQQAAETMFKRGLIDGDAGMMEAIGAGTRGIAAVQPGMTQEGMDIYSRGAGANYDQTKEGTMFGEVAETDRKLAVERQKAALGTDDFKTIEIDEGFDKVTYRRAKPGEQGNENGLIEIARGPRTTSQGDLQGPVAAGKAADFEADYGTILETGRGAMDRAREVDELIAYLAGGTDTGFWTERTLPLQQAITGLTGVGKEELARKEYIASQLGDRVMARIQETKGAVSEKEMEYFRLISASLGKTPYGNMLLLQKEKRMHERASQMRNYALSLPNNYTPQQATAALEQWRTDNPLFSDEEIQEIVTMQASGELGIGPGEGSYMTEDMDANDKALLEEYGTSQ